jgi:LPS-assembly protein
MPGPAPTRLTTPLLPAREPLIKSPFATPSASITVAFRAAATRWKSGKSCIRRAVAAALCAALATKPLLAAECPPTSSLRTTRTTPKSPEREESAARSAAADINFEADSVDATRDGQMLLEGDVTVTQGDRHIKTRDAIYDERAQRVTTPNRVEYTDPDLEISGASAEVGRAEGATFQDAEFKLRELNARGGAERIHASPTRKLELNEVRYTTCPLGNEDWMLSARSIEIDQNTGVGVGRGVRLDFLDVPILYAPFISFPVNNERKSGLLFPTIGTSSNNGYSLAVPWYWNIAPNYDATFTPTYFSKRGARFDNEFRYLSEDSSALFQAQYLPDDELFGEARSLISLSSQYDLNEHLRLDLDGANVSDKQWFEDFGLGPDGTSISFLERVANLTYLDDHWIATVRGQNFQVIDTNIPPALRPYTRVPQLQVRANFPDQPYGLTYGMDLEVDNFTHNLGVNPTGWRVDAVPEIRMPLRANGLYLEPAAAFRYTTYSLDGVAPGQDEAPSRAQPILSVDGGLVLERESGSRRQRLQTLEPRFKYLYVPFRNQSDLPVFDTVLPDLNLVELFRTNRYVGPDRQSDANQVAIGLTSRLLNAETGEQFISATIGQAYYFATPQVRLPNEVLPPGGYSDFVAELDVRAYRNWNIGMGVQWTPSETQTQRADVHLQYRPRHDQVANFGYRFRRGTLEQIEGSIGWPVSDQFSAYARMVYSLKDEKSLDQFAGLEYRACCWRVRAVARRYVTNRTGDRDTAFLLQLEFNGLSNVGVAADAFLERAIQGYSFRPPDL